MKKENEKDQYDHQTEFRITGLSRSGNHAVINWILGHLQEEKFCFLNCTEPKHNPFETCRPLGPDGRSWDTNIPNFSIEEERRGNFARKDYLLYSHEDSFLGPLQHPEFQKNRENWLGKTMRKNDILILRDPFNLFASRRKAGLLLGHRTHGAKPMSLKTLRRIYKQHAKEVLGRSEILRDKVIINFNRWVKDHSYRAAIAEELELQHTDEGMKEVSKVAGGSSFDGTSISAENLRRKLENRWKTYASEPQFRELFDAELTGLTRQIFGEIEPVRALSKVSKNEKKFSYSF
ncbi:MAG: hypothetical protein WCE57_13825 [Salegentibacter sp.]